MTLKDPRAMTLSDLTEFFKHVARREDSYGIPDAFRFHHVMRSRKSDETIPASYKHDGGDPVPEKSPPPRKKRRKAPKDMGNPAMLSLETPGELRIVPATFTESGQPQIPHTGAEAQTAPARAVQTLARGDYTSVNMVPSTYTESGQPRRGQISAQGDQTTARSDQTTARSDQTTARRDQTTARSDQTTARGDQTSTGQTQSKAARAGSDNGIGLHTPDNTPTPDANRNESTSPPLRNRGRRKNKHLILEEELPEVSSQKSKKKTKKSKK